MLGSHLARTSQGWTCAGGHNRGGEKKFVHGVDP
jgi:hypothetical protein